MSFKTGLKKSELMLSECKNCEKIVWPPSDFCDQCFRENSWKKSSGVGIILEVSKKDNFYFCVVEIENSIRIIGEVVNGIPEIGMSVKLIDCGIKDENYFFKLSLLK